MADLLHKKSSNSSDDHASIDNSNTPEKKNGDETLFGDSPYTNNDPEIPGKEKHVSISESETQLVRKIALRAMPLMIWISILQFADKTAISMSAVLGIYQDIRLSGTEFSWLGSIFFLGHLVCQPINNIMLQKLPVASVTGLFVLIYGAIMIASAYCQNFSQLLAMRFLLGFFEGRALPSQYLIVNTLFRRSEQPTYYGLIVIGNGVGVIFSSLIAYGVSQMGNQRGITMWRWNHIILGAISMLIGVLCTFLLVDDPRSRLLQLTEEEKKLTDERIEDNAVVRHSKLKWGQMLEALSEIQFWCICIATIGVTMQAGGVQVFVIQIFKNLGDFSVGESILLKMPSGVCGILCVLLTTTLVKQTKQLCYSAVLTCMLSLLGSILLATTQQTATRIIGIYLTVFWNGPYTILITIIGTNVYGYSKKIFYNGALVVCYTIGNFIGPMIMLEKQAPNYFGGMTGYCIGNGVAIACLLIMRLHMANVNKDRIKASAIGTPADISLDLTDKQDRNIIYRL